MEVHYVNIPMGYTVIFTFVKVDNFRVKKCDILSQTYNATLLSFDYFYVNAHALSKLFH